MDHRSIRILVAIAAVAALVAALVGSAVAAKPENPGSQGKGRTESGLKSNGVTKVKGGTSVLTIDTTSTLTALTGPGGIPIAPVSGASLVGNVAALHGKQERVLPSFARRRGFDVPSRKRPSGDERCDVWFRVAVEWC